MPDGPQPFFQQAPQLPQQQPGAPYPQYPPPGMLYPPPQMQPPPNQFDLNAWAQQQNVNMDELGGPEGMMNAMLAAVDKSEQTAQQLQQLQQQQQQQVNAQQPGQPPQDWKQWQSLLATDASGKIIAKPGHEYAVPSGVLFDANKAVTDRQQMLDGLLSNPAEWIQEKMGSDWLQEKIQAGVQDQLNRHKQDHGINEFVDSNAEWIYQKDQYGQPTKQYTQEGQRLMEIAQDLTSQGIESSKVLGLATQQFEVEMHREVRVAQQRALQQSQPPMPHQTMTGPPQGMQNPQQQQAPGNSPPQYANSPQQQQHEPTAPVGFESPNQQPQSPPNGTNFWQRSGLTEQGQVPPGAYGSQSRTVPEPALSPDESADAENIFTNVATQQGLLQPDNN